jgi:hypothetical protein
VVDCWSFFLPVGVDAFVSHSPRGLDKRVRTLVVVQHFHHPSIQPHMADHKKKKQRIDVADEKQPSNSRLQNHIPLVIQQHIFSFLDITDVRSLRSVNKFQMRFPRWTVLDLSDDDLEGFGMPVLKALDLFARQTERLETDHLSWYCAHTRRSLKWQQIVPFLQRVRHLDIQRDVNDDDTGRANLAAVADMAKLEILEWEGCRSMSAASMAPVLQKTNLRVLHLTRVLHNVTDTFFGHLPATLTELRLLETPVAFGRDQLARLLTTCPELTQVQLEVQEVSMRTMKPEDWKLLYSPIPRVWHEWSLNCPVEDADAPFPCFDVAALDHFARAKVQHTLDIRTGHKLPWSSALWKRFVERTGATTSPLRVLCYGQPVVLQTDPIDDVTATLMECFPHLHTFHHAWLITTSVQTIIRGYEQKWPLIHQHRVFPPPCFDWNTYDGDVNDVLDHLIDHAPSDYFEKLALEGAPLPDADDLHQVLLDQHHWRDIHIELAFGGLDIPDAVAVHLAHLPQLLKIEISVKRLDLSVHGLSTLLEHGGFEELTLYESDRRWTKTPLSLALLQQLWRNPHRRTVLLEHALLPGISALEWIALARDWTSTRRVTFMCCVPSTEWPTGNEQGPMFEIDREVVRDEPSVTRLTITTTPHRKRRCRPAESNE